MQEPELDDPGVQARIRVLQIIAGSLLLSVLIFLGVVLFLVQQEGGGLNPPQGPPVLTYVCLGFFVAQFLVWFFLPPQMIKTGVGKIAEGAWEPPPGAPPALFASDTGKLLAVLQSARLVGWALMEGVAFFGCIAYLLEAEPAALGVTGAALLVNLLTFPTRGNVRRWLETQRTRISDLRRERV